MDQAQGTGIDTAAPGPDPWLAVRNRELDLEESKHRVTMRLQCLALVTGESTEDRIEKAKAIEAYLYGP